MIYFHNYLKILILKGVIFRINYSVALSSVDLMDGQLLSSTIVKRFKTLQFGITHKIKGWI